ncbi:hypothetical protein C5471_00130 [Photorhabdus tasmaniensis]|uniref:Sugar ABC transporter permease n=1 Tax=Photorhabdus tasmaniensis TaxID=1004159 RepID=A0ABX0GBG4_9GAMM|nr:hypothetical protein [Photorhabdus tasmaniensis]
MEGLKSLLAGRPAVWHLSPLFTLLSLFWAFPYLMLYAAMVLTTENYKEKACMAGPLSFTD